MQSPADLPIAGSAPCVCAGSSTDKKPDCRTCRPIPRPAWRCRAFLNGPRKVESPLPKRPTRLALGVYGDSSTPRRRVKKGSSFKARSAGFLEGAEPPSGNTSQQMSFPNGLGTRLAGASMLSASCITKNIGPKGSMRPRVFPRTQRDYSRSTWPVFP